MKWICIENKGEMDILSFVLMGASTKRGDDSKIGMFGSGLKYAITYFLRTGHEMIVKAGADTIRFTTEPVTLRGQDFRQVIVLKGSETIPTSFTLNMGEIDWDNWKAVREIVCNAIDEGEYRMTITNDIPDTGNEGKTKFYISYSSQVRQILDDWNHYFGFERNDAIERVGKVVIYPNLFPTKTVIYRKGIMVQEFGFPSLFTYDVEDAAITEDRVLKDVSQAKREIVLALSGSLNTRIVSSVLDLAKSKDSRFFESLLDFSDWHLPKFKFSQTWIDAIGSKIIFIYEKDEMRAEKHRPEDYIFLPAGLGVALKKKLAQRDHDDEDRVYVEVNDPVLMMKLQNMIDTKLTPYNIEVSEEIGVCEFLRDDIGMYVDSNYPGGAKIFVSSMLVEVESDKIIYWLYEKFLVKHYKKKHNIAYLGSDKLKELVVESLYKQIKRKYEK